MVNAISCILFQITISTTFCSRRLVVPHKVHTQWAHWINLQRHDSQPSFHDEEALHHWHWPSCCGNQSWQCHYISPGHENYWLGGRYHDCPTGSWCEANESTHYCRWHQCFCVVSSFLLQRKHSSTNLNFCHNHINGFTHSQLHRVRHQCHC